MARHKFAGNGIVLTTALSEADLRKICEAVDTETKGDLWNGSYKILPTRSGSDWVMYEFRNFLKISHLDFAVHFAPTADGRMRLHTVIHEFFTTQTKLYYLIPLSPKKMVAHHSYLQFM